ncbi:unnamed protein product [Camellia sinensis]
MHQCCQWPYLTLPESGSSAIHSCGGPCRELKGSLVLLQNSDELRVEAKHDEERRGSGEARGNDGDDGETTVTRCNCGKKAAVFISESEKNPGRLYFKCANRMCEYFGWGPASTGNASDIQRKSKASHMKNEDERCYDYDVDKLNQIINRLERVEANQEAMKLFLFTAIVLIGFTMLIALLK